MYGGKRMRDWNSLGGSRSVFDAAADVTRLTRMMDTGAVGSLDRHMRDIALAARPIETDGGMRRLLDEQLAAYRTLDTGFDRLSATATGIPDVLAALESARLDLLDAVDSPMRNAAHGLASQLHDHFAGSADTTLSSVRDAIEASMPDLSGLLESVNTPARDLVDRLASIPAEVSLAIEQLQPSFEYQQTLIDQIQGASSLLTEAWDPAAILRQTELAELGGLQQAALDSLRLATDCLLDFSEPEDESSAENTIDREELRAALAEVGLHASAGIDPESLRAIVFQAVQQVREKPRSVYVVVLRYLIQGLIAILLGISGNLLTPDIENLRTNSKVVRRELSWAANQLDADPVMLRTLRVVLRHDLPVFAKRNKNSSRVAELQLGDVVILLKKRRNWAFVEWRSSDGTTEIRGWVFARRLGSITRESVPRRVRPEDLVCSEE